MAWIRTKIPIPEELSKDERVRLSNEIINFIQERSMAGYDKNDQKFVKYSKTYADKKGVGVNQVDLVLSGEMLDSLKLLTSKKGELTIGYDKGSDVNGKAEGNIKGTYGQPKPVTKPRDFLGIDPALVEILAQDFMDEKNPIDEIDIDAEAKKIANEIFGEDIFG